MFAVLLRALELSVPVFVDDSALRLGFVPWRPDGIGHGFFSVSGKINRCTLSRPGPYLPGTHTLLLCYMVLLSSAQ